MLETNAGLPSLRSRLRRTEEKIVDAWAVHDQGEIVIVDRRWKVAVWHGQFDERDEAPVIAAAATYKSQLLELTRQQVKWFCGIAVSQACEDLSDDMLDTLVDVSQYQVPSATSAVNFLQSMMQPFNIPWC